MSIPHPMDIPRTWETQTAKFEKESMKLNWNFQRGLGGFQIKNNLGRRRVWMFSGTTHIYELKFISVILITVIWRVVSIILTSTKDC